MARRFPAMLVLLAPLCASCRPETTPEPAPDAVTAPALPVIERGQVPPGFAPVDVREPARIPRDGASAPPRWNGGPFRLVQSMPEWLETWPLISTVEGATAVDFNENIAVVVRHPVGSDPVKPWVVRQNDAIRVVLDQGSLEPPLDAEGEFFYYVFPRRGGYVASIDIR